MCNVACNTEPQPQVTRVATAFTALSHFFSETPCRSCEVLELCLNHLQADLSQQRSASPKKLLQTLRRMVPFSSSHRRCESRRCLPAEILMAYLTRGGELPQTHPSSAPPAA
jgi:hypothetical protein